MRTVFLWSSALAAALLGLFLALALRVAFDQQPTSKSESFTAIRLDSDALQTKKQTTPIPSKKPKPEGSEDATALFHVYDIYSGKPVLQLEATTEGEEAGKPMWVRENSFSLSGPSPVRGSLKVGAEGYFGIATELSRLPQEAVNLFLVPAEPIIIHCVDAESRSAVPGVEIRMTGADERTLATGKGGRAVFHDATFYLPGHLLSDPENLRYELIVAAHIPGYLSSRKTLLVHPDTSWNDVELFLEPAVALGGLVRDSRTHQGISRASIIHQWRFRGRELANRKEEVVKSDAEGRFSLLVRKGATQVQVVAIHRDYAAGQLVLENLPVTDYDERNPVVIDLEEAYPVEGIVLDEGGNPVKNVTVDIDPLERPDFTQWMRFAAYKHVGHLPDFSGTNEEGVFYFERVPAGRYRVILDHKGYLAEPDNPELVVGPEVTGWVGILRRGLSVQGRVIYEDGSPAEGASVVLFQHQHGIPVKGYAKSSVAGEDGAFRVSGLARGEHSVIVNMPTGESYAVSDIDSEMPPEPWLVVLSRTEQPQRFGRGTLRIFVKQEGGLALPEGIVEITLFPPDEDEAQAFFVAELHAGEVFLRDVPIGLYTACVVVKGYAPMVTENVFVANDDVDPETVVMTLPPSIPVSVRADGNTKGGTVRVRSLSRGILITKVSYDSGSQDVTVLLQPGRYQAVFESEKETGQSREFFLEKDTTTREVAIPVRPKRKQSQVGSK